MKNTRLKTKIKEGITNLSNMGVIPADEAQLNMDVLYDSILDEVCAVVPMESPRQIVSCLKLIYDSEKKSQIKLTGDITVDAFKIALMNGVGSVPFNDNGYPTNEVNCTIIPNNDGEFLANYAEIIPGTVNIANEYTDDGEGKLINKTTGAEFGTLNYHSGLFKFTGSLPASANLSYKYDIYNLDYMPNFAKFVKSFVEIFADMFALDINTALVLNDFKGLDLKKNIENILPQVLTQQIDQFILNKYFKQAKLNPVYQIPNITENTYGDVGTHVSKQMGEFITKFGVLPNIIICNPKGYGELSTSIKFQPLTGEDMVKTAGMPKVVGYFNNAKVILTTTSESDIDIVLTYRGDSDAQAAGVFTPYIPVTLRTVDGMEGGGMITTTNVYSMGGFAMINPDLVKGIVIA